MMITSPKSSAWMAFLLLAGIVAALRGSTAGRASSTPDVAAHIQASLRELPSPAGSDSVRQVGQEGPRGEAVRIATLSASRASGYPRMVRSQDTLVWAWTDAAQPPRVRTSVARIVP